MKKRKRNPDPLKGLTTKDLTVLMALAEDARLGAAALLKRIAKAVELVNGEFGELFTVELGAAGAQELFSIKPTKLFRAVQAAAGAAKGDGGGIERAAAAVKVFKGIFRSGHRTKASGRGRKKQ